MKDMSLPQLLFADKGQLHVARDVVEPAVAVHGAAVFVASGVVGLACTRPATESCGRQRVSCKQNTPTKLKWSHCKNCCDVWGTFGKHENVYWFHSKNLCCFGGRHGSIRHWSYRWQSFLIKNQQKDRK